MPKYQTLPHPRQPRENLRQLSVYGADKPSVKPPRPNARVGAVPVGTRSPCLLVTDWSPKILLWSQVFSWPCGFCAGVSSDDERQL